MKLIEYAEKQPKLVVKAIAECYEIGKMQVSDILKNKKSILAAFEANVFTHRNVEYLSSQT